MPTSRRKVLALAALSPLALLARARAAVAAPACYDPDALPLSQNSRRRALRYAEPSDDPARHCGACTYFTASSEGCGACAMLGGGPVNAGAVCGSFAPKAK